MLKFKNATINDIPLIAQLADKIWKEHYPSIISQDQINYMLQSRYSQEAITVDMKKGEKYFIAYCGEKAVAYASIEWHGGFYYLHKFYIDVSSHRKGFGRQLFDYLLSQIDDLMPIKLQVNRQNIKAVNFYFKIGFEIESATDFDIGGGYYMNDFVMVRKI